MSPRFKFTTKDLIAKAKTSQKNIDEMRSWLETTEYPSLSDEQISLFLICCKNNIEDTKKRIDTYFKVKRGPMFEHMDIDYPNNKTAAQVCYYAKLPRRTREGAVIIVHRLRDFCYSNYVMEQSMRVYFMLTELALIENPPNGVYVLFDMAGMGFMHLTRAKLSYVKTFFDYLEKAFPSYLRDVHIFNTLPLIDKVMVIVKPFMSQELYSKLNFHPPGIDMEEFSKKHISLDFIPSDYGGRLDSVQALHDATIQEMRDNKAYFEDEMTQRHQYLNKKC